jgi:O-antigen/teichoic acid export membrane protein
MDKIMIKQILGSTENVGLYSAAIAICGMIGFIPGAILDSGRPLIVEAKGRDEQLYQLRIRQLSAGVIWICVIYSIGITVFSKLAIQILYGDAYIGANLCLKIAVWYTAFSYLGSGRSLWLICEKKNKYVFLFSAMGAATNLVLNFIMIPLWGINGAAIATLLTQIMANFIYPTLFKETRQYTKCVSDALRLENINLKNICIQIRQKIRRKL